MPFIHTQVNRPIDPAAEKEMARKLGKAIELLNKSESWLMLQFEDNCHLYFKGDSQKPLAFVNVKLLGGASKEQYNSLTAEITHILADTLSISPDGVYVEYDETDYWGWNGANL